MSLHERSGKRNLTYNKRHRLYGKKLIMEDIDCIEYDYHTDEAVAVIETKFGANKTVDFNDRQVKRQIKLADKLNVPFFINQYYLLDERKQLMVPEQLDVDPSHVQYFLIPGNRLSYKFISEPSCMTEREYVELLYKLRGEPTIKPDIKLFDKWIYTACIELPQILNQPIYKLEPIVLPMTMSVILCD